jgi:hypothetical protein
MTHICRDKNEMNECDELELQRIALLRRREELIDDLDDLNKRIQVITSQALEQDLSGPRS